MTALKAELVSRIRALGPMALADYMAACLMHPVHGYYQKERVFGAEGDFITAPEVSQMFGEMVGLWLADRWIALGRPARVSLVELGPGRGTLMADILRTAARVPGFQAAATVHFVEASRQLRALQAEKVPDATWHDDILTLPTSAPLLIVANEFFDALPIHQFERTGGIWRERMVGEADGRLGFIPGPASPMAGLIDPSVTASAAAGAIAEVCPMGVSVMGTLAGMIAEQGGAFLALDYGYATSATGDTFQALKSHAYTDPFAEPGAADLTAHVDFAALARAAAEKGASASRIADQGTFLMTLGIGARAEALAASGDPARILADLKRLTAPDEMGTLFKALAVQSPGLTPPPGF